MLVVTDASPLNYLAWIESVEILPKPYSKVTIPPEVRHETLAVDAPAVVRSWTYDLPSWTEIQAPDAAFLDDPAVAILGPPGAGGVLDEAARRL